MQPACKPGSVPLASKGVCHLSSFAVTDKLTLALAGGVPRSTLRLGRAALERRFT